MGWTYLGLIWFGSVHLGWHYFTDGIVGIAGALLVWRLAGAIGAAQVSRWLPVDELLALNRAARSLLVGFARTKTS
jgi:hypothetical protein